MGRIQFWLSQGGDRLRLPVNPESISVSTAQGYEDYDVAQLGQYTVIGDRQLDTFNFSSFFPREFNPSYCEYEAIPAPQDALDTLLTWRDNRKPARLTVTGTAINTLVTIRDIDYDPERAGSPGDIYYTIDFSEYRPVEFRVIQIEQETTVATSSTRPDEESPPQTYTVRSGDTLWGIAQRFLGDGSRYPEIYSLNRSTIGKDPNLIHPGQRLQIP